LNQDDQTTGTGQPADMPVAPTTDRPIVPTPTVEEMPASTPPAAPTVPGVDTPAPTFPTSPVTPGEEIPTEMPPVVPVTEEGGTEGPGDTTPPAPTV